MTAVLRPGVLRVVEREARVFRRLWRGPVVLSVITPAMFLSAMGLGLGGLVDQGTGELGGLRYVDFVAPGLLVASAMQVAAGESLWPVMGGKKWMRTYHAMVATPLNARDLAGGLIVWNGVRTAMSATAFLAVATVLGGVSSWWAPLAILPAMGCAMAVAGLLAAYSIGQESDLSFAVVMRVAVLPLFLFSGTFFPVDQLPDWVQPLAVVSPLWHGVELARGATTGSIEGLAAAGHVAALAAFLVAGWTWAGRRFSRELQA